MLPYPVQRTVQVFGGSGASPYAALGPIDRFCWSGLGEGGLPFLSVLLGQAPSLDPLDPLPVELPVVGLHGRLRYYGPVRLPRLVRRHRSPLWIHGADPCDTARAERGDL